MAMDGKIDAVLNMEGDLKQDEQYLKVWRVAKRLDVHRSTIHRLVKAGKLEAVQIENAVRVSVSSLLTYLEANRIRPENKTA